MPRYTVSVPWHDGYGENWPSVYSFEASSDAEAIAAFRTEREKYCQYTHKTSRLFSGGVFWKNAVLHRSGESTILEEGRS